MNKALATGHFSHRILGYSVDERPINSLVLNKATAANPKHVWIQHRQHPGEVSASWFCDGVLNKLTQLCDARAAGQAVPLLDQCVFVVVPNCNPDGGVRGHLRTNASGANLNRCWGGLHGLTKVAGQTTPPAPEVEALIAGMKSLPSLDVMLDIHQDEEKPYVFISKTPYGCPSCTKEIRETREKFLGFLRKRSPDFETPGPVDPVGYPEPEPGKANLSICSAAVAEAFPGCISMTMEHPYKGNDNAGEVAKEGFTVKQCRDLGEATIEALGDILPFIC
jgi:murein tripeptide amidase MpaA